MLSHKYPHVYAIIMRNSYSEGATYLVYINGEHKRMTASAMIISRLVFKSQPYQVRVSSHSFENTHTDIFYLRLYGIINNESFTDVPRMMEMQWMMALGLGNFEFWALPHGSCPCTSWTARQ
jgi:hypothetical protein